MKSRAAFLKKSLKVFVVAVIVLGIAATGIKLLAELKPEAIDTLIGKPQKNGVKSFEQTQKLSYEQYELTIMKELGPDGMRDDAKKTGWVQKAAASGNHEAQFELAYKYSIGEGVPHDDVKAFELLQKVVAAGHPDDQYRVGLKYLNGEGVTQDNVKGFEWVQKAAMTGYRPAEAKLWWLYKNGIGVAKNEDKAAEWHQKGRQ